jgi:hypothetical protein
MKGGVAYMQQRENNFIRENYTMHGAVAISANASFGVRYSYLIDKLPNDYSPRHEVNHQVALGYTYIVDEDTVLGILVTDPTRTTPGEERVLAGFQYDLADRIMLIGDVGTQYTKDVKKKYLWRGALQINVFSDFFIRAGKFYDNVSEFQGTGWGASWVGPRLGIEFAQKVSDKFNQDSYVYKNEKIVDTSLSAILKF